MTGPRAPNVKALCARRLLSAPYTAAIPVDEFHGAKRAPPENGRVRLTQSRRIILNQSERP
eukprot:scaffold2893_cov254-Pinguiococcus_pyrenoidosus.AAC.6